MSAPPKYTCPSKTSSSKKVPLTGYPETSSDDEIPIAAKMSTALVVQAVVPSVVAPRDKKNSFPCPRDVKYVLAREDASKTSQTAWPPRGLMPPSSRHTAASRLTAHREPQPMCLRGQAKLHPGGTQAQADHAPHSSRRSQTRSPCTLHEPH